MRRSLTRVRNPGRGREQPKNTSCSKDSPMGADNDAHCAESHIDTLEVGIADEDAYSKIVSRRRVDQSGCSIHYSNRLDEPRNFAPRHEMITSKLGKRRPKVSENAILRRSHIGCPR